MPIQPLSSRHGSPPGKGGWCQSGRAHTSRGRSQLRPNLQNFCSNHVGTGATHSRARDSRAAEDKPQMHLAVNAQLHLQPSLLQGAAARKPEQRQAGGLGQFRHPHGSLWAHQTAEGHPRTKAPARDHNRSHAGPPQGTRKISNKQPHRPSRRLRK